LRRRAGDEVLKDCRLKIAEVYWRRAGDEVPEDCRLKKFIAEGQR